MDAIFRIVLIYLIEKMQGKRERPSCEEETAARLTGVYDKIKKKYADALVAIREETKSDPLDVV